MDNIGSLLKLPLVLLLISFVVVAVSAIACNWIVYTMIRRVNRAKSTGALLRFFGSSWRTVVAEYRKLHRTSPLGRVLIAASCTAFVAVLATLYLLFYAVPRSFPAQ